MTNTPKITSKNTRSNLHIPWSTKAEFNMPPPTDQHPRENRTMNRKVQCRIATLNARSLLSDKHKNTKSNLIRHLKSKVRNIDIFCLQYILAAHTKETISDYQEAQLKNMNNQTYYIVTKKVGAFCLKSTFRLENAFITNRVFWKELESFDVSIVSKYLLENRCPS
ncbi:hypothetical protein INT43_000156 [Umbelopsis isabellina]|uniref:Uncharacterized protein n=1 Tax=Mortierella isabellina TaxID=91625 RepID=A0A8H7UAS0_MORIS|nr:hypothetical protein INT43_000156 [Umbelopsis isabellina]